MGRNFDFILVVTEMSGRLLQNHTSQKLVNVNIVRVKAASVGTAQEDQNQERDGGRACW